MHTPDLTASNIEKLAALFPGCVTEAKDKKGALTRAIDFDQLRQELSDNIVDGPRERYHLDWPGKREALLAANAPIAKTLRPCREESVDFDTTKNLFIEGDNLDALKLLQETYLGSVKLIYIDPPYNTGGDFLYDDDFGQNARDFFVRSNQRDDAENHLTANPESNGRFHSDWLSMLYPRLKLARNVLSDDGLLIMHMDEHEHANAANILEEIFGARNLLGVAVWDKKNPKGDATRLAYQHETVFIVAKDVAKFAERHGGLKRLKKNALAILNKAKHLYARLGLRDLPADLKECANRYDLPSSCVESHLRAIDEESISGELSDWVKRQDFSGGEAAYCKVDENGEVYRLVSMAWPNKKTAPQEYFIPLKHPITGKDCPVPERGWRNPPETMKRLLAAGEIIFGIDHTTQPQRKYLLRQNLNENIPSVLGYAGSDDAMLTALGIPFEHPKPVEFARELIGGVLDNNDIILDFFAGSGTAAHAAMLHAVATKTAPRWIMAQLPEPFCEQNKEHSAAVKFCKKNDLPLSVAELTKERIRRAGTKIKAANQTTAPNLDIGFRVLKIDTSNMSDVYYAPDAVKQADLLASTNNIKPDRTAEDLLFQVLVDWGVDLSLPIVQETVAEMKVFFVDGNALAACFDPKVSEDLVKEMAKRKPLRAVFRDSSYDNDSVKINVEQIFKLLSPETEVKSL